MCKLGTSILYLRGILEELSSLAKQGIRYKVAVFD